jgi:hypothetical protein
MMMMMMTFMLKGKDLEGSFEYYDCENGISDEF